MHDRRKESPNNGDLSVSLVSYISHLHFSHLKKKKILRASYPRSGKCHFRELCVMHTEIREVLSFFLFFLSVVLKCFLCFDIGGLYLKFALCFPLSY